MQLFKACKLAIHKPISSNLPYYRKDVGNQVTVYHLLTHTHGIAEGYDRLPPVFIFKTRIFNQAAFQLE